MFEKMKLFLSLFREGEEVADPKLWKDRQSAANKIAAILGTLVLLAKAFGIAVPISSEELAGLALFVGGVGNWVFTVITSKKVGVPAVPAEPVQPVGQADPAKDTYIG